MATTEQFSLRWNNFHSNLTSGFHELLEAAEMVDVTLAVDGHFLQAHKIVLSICSPFFKQMFKVNPCKHPVVILKDVGHENMKDILEFMYMGEVSVLRENLTQFLRTAELLQVKGLTGDDPNEDSPPKENKTKCDNQEDDNSDIYSDISVPISYKQSQEPCNMVIAKRPYRSSNGSNNNNSKRPKSEPHQPRHLSPPPLTKPSTEYEPIRLKNEQTSDTMTNLSNTDVSNTPINASTTTTAKSPMRIEDNKDLMNSLKSIWDQTISAAAHGADLNTSDPGRSERQNKNLFQCGQCLKRFSRRDHLRTHEKNIHGEFAGPFKCAICEQLYKNTESLRKHIAKFHFSTINENIQRIEVNV